MDYKSVRKGNTQAGFNENASTWLFFELIVISFMIGGFTFNWIIGVAAFIILTALLFFKKTKKILLVLLTILATILGGILGGMFGGIIGAIVLGILFLLISGGLHIGAYEWTEDMN
ncbi:hypothetical protein [Gracilibacillus alcaliphilus]|uniref:hypothetical protein n=1 Tax=Gracilibacillus alcaliphilus TaxID=1401441 RepID=UPI001957C836|nr:hypothetical protein [Gracilibacillus alcaliphilus]MBM7678928.1 4-hydroxybenzoate polyprenyltransferase [Gracilibacillus alcaliphilus]